MSRKVTVNITVKTTMQVDEGVEVSEVVNELDYNFDDTTTKATVEDTEIVGYEVTDSR